MFIDDPLCYNKIREMIRLQLQVKVNPINEMKKLRTSVYGDRLAWIEELLQNCQRAKATKVKMSFNSDFVIFEDNGIGCDNPEVLFEKSVSGWDSATAEEEGAFGEGFFSVLMVADLVEIWSKFGYVKFDIKKMFEDNTVDCIDWDNSGSYSGFRVKLSSLLDGYDSWLARERAKLVAQYLKGMECTIIWNNYNYGVVPVKDFTEDDGTPYCIKVDTPEMVGWLRPYSYTDLGRYTAIEVFYQNRYVKEYHPGGLAGTLLIKNHVIDLRCPDRKDFIYNDKYTAFKDKVRELGQEVYRKVLLSGTDQDLDTYSNFILDYLPLEEVIPHLTFLLLDSNAPGAITEEQLARIKEAAAQGIKLDFQKIAELLMPPPDNDNQFVPNIVTQFEGDLGPIDLPPQQIIVKPQEEDNKPSKRLGVKLDGYRLLFYVNIRDVAAYNDTINEIRYHGLPVVLYRNRMEERVLEHMNAQHVSEFHKEVRLVASLRNSLPQDGIEERAAFLFRVIAKALKQDENLFQIGDLTVHREIVVPGLEPRRELTSALAVAQGDVIFIDRTALRKSCLKASNSNNILLSDKAFIAKNLEVLSHELAHVIFKTVDNTASHFKAQLEIQDVILNSLF